MTRHLLIPFVLLGCATPQRPPPQPTEAEKREVAWTRYCAELRQRGIADNDRGDCQRLYDYQMARLSDAQAASAQVANQQYEEDRRRRKAWGRALEAFGAGMSGRRPIHCTTTQDGDETEPTCY